METDIDRLITLSTQIRKLMLQQSKVSFEEKAATLLQSQILTYLEEKPEAKMSELAGYINTSLSSATQIVERMVQAKFVKRIQDEKDRRVVLLTITESGREELKNLKRAKRERMKKLFSKIDNHDIKELIRIQEKILLSLQDNE